VGRAVSDADVAAALRRSVLVAPAMLEALANSE